jgi:hypothetical protein
MIAIGPFTMTELDEAGARHAEVGHHRLAESLVIDEVTHREPDLLTLERMANAQLFAKVRGREFQSAMQAWQTSVPDAHGNASRPPGRRGIF